MLAHDACAGGGDPTATEAHGRRQAARVADGQDVDLAGGAKAPNQKRKAREATELDNCAEREAR